MLFLGRRDPQTVVQGHPAVELHARPLLYVSPHCSEGLVAVHEVARGRLRALYVADGRSEEEASSLGPEERDAVLEQRPLLVQAEDVDNHAEVDEVDVSLEPPERAIIGQGQRIRLEEMQTGFPVSKQLIAELDERPRQLGPVHALGWCSVCNKLANVLAQTAADVQVLGSALQATNHRLVGRLLVQAEGEELELSNTRVWIDIPCFVPLLRRGVSSWAPSGQRAVYLEDDLLLTIERT